MSFICKNKENNCKFEDFIKLNNEEKISKYNNLKDDLISIDFDYNKICQYYYRNFDTMKNIVNLDIAQSKVKDVKNLSIYKSKSNDIINNIEDLKTQYKIIFDKKVFEDMDIYDTIIEENKKKIKEISMHCYKSYGNYMSRKYIYNEENDNFIAIEDDMYAKKLNITILKKNIYEYLFENARETSEFYDMEYSDNGFFN